jgi:hypothetical protein
MVFGTMGRMERALVVLIWLTVAGAAMAQTGDGCELPLVVPDVNDITVDLRSTSRGPGVLLTWPEPPDSASTCVALVDTAGLGLPVSVTGDYGDGLDRTFEFSFNTSGSVGDTTQNRHLCTWRNVNSARTGNVVGIVNLANTGGLWVRTEAGWARRNQGFPVYLPNANLISIALADDGTLLASLTSGSSSQVSSDPIGVYRATSDGVWQQVAADVFGRTLGARKVAVRPDDSRYLAIGTAEAGVFISADGGATFTQWTSALDPDAPGIPPRFEVTALHWTASRLYVAVLNYGLFISEDGGSTFVRASALEVPITPGSSSTLRPTINVIAEDPGDPDRVLVGLTNHGVWASTDGGATWASILVDYDGSDVGWTVSVTSLVVSADDPDHIVVGTIARLLRQTLDGGVTWTPSVTPFDDLETKPRIWDVVAHDGGLLAQVNNIGLIESTDVGATWTLVADQPYNRLARDLHSDGTVLYLPSTGGGMYQAGTPILLTDSLLRADTDPELRAIDLGLSITFDEGSITLVDANGDGDLDERSFRLVAQDYQGWIVWRSPRGNPDEMVMIGRYDKNNPETCIEGYCGDENFVILPNCFAERRAACFAFPAPGFVSFYDDEVFNGFTYQYAVTPYDFGDISRVIDPITISNPMVFPARFAGDEVGVGDGPGNQFAFQVNTEAAAALDGDEIYAYPNPLRLGAGIVGGEGEEVIWTNLPPDSQIQIFTLAGDEIAELPRDGRPQEGANMYSVARNADNRLLASGIYMWRVIMPERGDFRGKLVIIN